MRRNVSGGWEDLDATVRGLDRAAVLYYVDSAREPTALSMPTKAPVQGTGTLSRELTTEGFKLTVGDMMIWIARERFTAFRTVFGTDEPGGEPFLNWYEVYVEPGLVVYIEVAGAKA